MPKIYDNIENHLVKGLNETLALSKRADFCVGYFNLRGWKEVADYIDKFSGETVIEGEEKKQRFCRLLVGMQKLPSDALRESFIPDDSKTLIDQAEANKIKKKLAQEFKEQLTIGAPSELDEIALRKLSRQMKDNKVTVKLHLRYPLHAKLYLAYSNNKIVPVIGFLGSSNLTLAGLANQGELNVDVLEQDAANKLAKWFDDRWNDRWCIDITKELIEIIDNSWASERIVLPYHIYLKMVYHLSQDARAGLSEFQLPKELKAKLLDFQEKAVLIGAHHLNKRGGVMIGDVVGLGKTIMAIAIAKIFEDDFFLETLIICPTNLKKLWEQYKDDYRLRSRVISIAEAQNVLPTLRRYRLIIIDESQNLRNSDGVRYRAIKEYIEENESKVILLSATPYNKSYIDLSNQLRLFIPEDKDLGVSPERYIESIGGKIQFMVKHTDTFVRSIKAFEDSDFSDDWRELMKLYMVRRTRSFIKNNYAQTDPENGRKFLSFSDGSRSYFPDRVPKKVEYKFDPYDVNDQYSKLYSEKVVDTINGLNLPRYGLANYLEQKPTVTATTKEEVIFKNLSRAGKRLMGFCRTNLFKRLESSGYSFLLSLSRHIMRNFIFIYAIVNNLPLPIGKEISGLLDDYLDDEDLDHENKNEGNLKILVDENEYLRKAKEIYKALSNNDNKHKFDWIRSEFFNVSLKDDLIKDSLEILKIIKIGGNWDPNKDRQLEALYNLIAKDHPDEKMIVFTQFADTAYYLIEQLKKRGIEEIECVTGESEDPMSIAERFSPISNNKLHSPQELRILISTDVLSEGQNLQDAHVVLNYDLPWALIRLVQRTGRIDRIGQRAEKIICYSFLPEDGLEKIIRLRGRLKDRIKQNAEVVGSDETFFDGDPINVRDLYNERSGIFDEEEGESDIDFTSYAYQIWKNALDKDPSLDGIIPDLPNVVYTTKKNPSEKEKEGVIVYMRTAEDNDVLTWISRKGVVISQSQVAILKAAQCDPTEQPLIKIPTHHELVNQAIELIRKEEKTTFGALGRKSGVKYRTYMRLDRYYKENENTLFATDDLKKAIDDIYKYPIREFARDTLSRQLKAGVSDEDLAKLVVSLREEGKLSIVDEEEQLVKEPKIICSLGLKND